MTPRLTAAELARALTEAGRPISRQGIDGARRNGRITCGADGKYDLAQAEAELEANTSQAKMTAGRTQRGIPKGLRRDADADGETKNQAETRKEIALANLRELDEAEKRWSLVPKEGVQRTWNAIAMTIKTKLLSVGARLAPLVAVESDAALCKAILDQDMRSILEELSQAELPEPV